MKNKFTVTYPDGSHPKKVPERPPVVQEAIASSKDRPAAHMPEKITALPLYGIRIKDDGNKVSLVSCLRATNPYNENKQELYRIYEAKVTMLEDVIQAHYEAGVKVTSKGYLKGLEDVVDNLKKRGG